ncbi:hypothetical protein Poly41_47410 [Novipirellula artificiosorum]|uniref:Uncharacterized protein n=2 Tax=Novipirellula artificiosorum TaxID=2528016 RepID=A0A5C6DCY9_9BACT|nr:hypothetical protein Poly41_47410 [Novipirellula artificiosorum]
MHEEYHGWDVEDEEKGTWKFAEVYGHKKGADTFVIEDFGAKATTRVAVSAMLAATKQFKCKLHVSKTDRTMSLLNQLAEKSMLKMASVRSGGQEEVGVLAIRATPPAKPRPWWKFW